MRVICRIYQLLWPLAFLGFLPGLLWKLWRRPGWKTTFGERFGHFSRARRAELAAYRGCTWIHAISVGESVIALNLAKALLARNPGLKLVLSCGTTTAQEMLRKQCPAGAAVIFCPLDYAPFVRKTMNLLQPQRLLIFETEIWPCLILRAKRSGAKVALINARLSDHSARGYRRWRFFFAPLLAQFDCIFAQSEADAERFRRISPAAKITATGNLKFDQKPPENFTPTDLSGCFGAGDCPILMGASTHPGEEAVLIAAFQELKKRFPVLKLLLVPRHAERGGEIADLLAKAGVAFHRRSLGGVPAAPVDCVLADTTGEMLALMAPSTVVLMGKSIAGHDEGHNLIEPALLEKPIVTGAVLKNFRFLLKVLQEADAVRTVKTDAELVPALTELFADPEAAQAMGRRAAATIAANAGALERTIAGLERL